MRALGIVMMRRTDGENDFFYSFRFKTLKIRSKNIIIVQPCWRVIVIDVIRGWKKNCYHTTVVGRRDSSMQVLLKHGAARALTIYYYHTPRSAGILFKSNETC